MLINNITPVLFKLGSLEIRYYGIIYALGFILTYFFLRYFIKKGKLEGINLKELDDLILYLLVGVVVGARILNFVFYEPAVFFTKPLEILMIWNGGLSFHGGLIGAVVAGFIFSRKKKIKLICLLDALAIPAALGLAFGRIANFTNHELYGPLSNLPWCVKFMLADGLCRHPYQLYASLSHFIMFGLLLYIYFRQKRNGTTFWSFVLIYGGFRVITDIFREEMKYFGLISMGQILSLVMFLIGVAILIKKKS
jgi:phosphatidylglycerol:prolipoprotein diacylglycerol transferase